MPFVLLLSIFIAILTVRDNMILATIFFLILIIIWFRQKKIKPTRRLLISGLAFFLSIFSFLFRQSIYAPDASSNKIIWLAKITNIQDADSYIIDYEGQSFFLETDKKYQIWDNIFLEWNIAPGFTWNILDIQNQRQNLTNISAYKFSYTKRLISKNIQWTIYPKSILVQSKEKPWPISQVRNSLKSKIIKSYWDNKISWLILWMLIWDKTILPSVDYENFKDSWLVHIIAVSGWNIVMIVVFLSFVLFFLPYYVRIVVILFSIIFYALICGLDSSVLRATIMWWLGLIALLSGRNMDKWRILAIAYISMLVYNPYYLAYDIWFLFSFSAVIGIILISERFMSNGEDIAINPPVLAHHPSFLKEDKNRNVCSLRPKGILQRTKSSDFAEDKELARSFLRLDWGFIKKIRKHISVYLIPSIGATMGIFPFMIFFINKINLISIFWNLLILPIIPFVMIYGFISVFLFDLTWRHFIIYIEEILVDYIFLISDLVSKWWIYLSLEAGRLRYGLIVVFVILLIRVSKR